MKRYKGIVKFILISISIAIITGVNATPVFGTAMQSDNWKIEQDSVNFGGGWSASDNYSEQDTLGEIATGWTYSDSYSLHAGYQQMDQETYISLSMNTSTVLSPSISGLAGGVANGQETIAVMTNNIVGYTLQLESNTAPALQKNATTTIADYTTGAYPDFNWSVQDTDSEFGFSPEGTDIVQLYRDDGAANCNIPAGSDTADRCWDSVSTTPKSVSISSIANEPTGSTTTVKLRAAVGNNHLQISGTYHASIIVTAFVN